MTSTSTKQGMDLEKPSSRVLRPPGGASSFSLGGYEEPAAKASPPVKAPPASNVFGASEPAAASAATPPPRTTEGRIFGNPDTQNTQTASQKQKSGGINPITGEPIGLPKDGKENEEANKQQGNINPITGQGVDVGQSMPSTKVRQPPGGASQGLW